MPRVRTVTRWLFSIPIPLFICVILSFFAIASRLYHTEKFTYGFASECSNVFRFPQVLERMHRCLCNIVRVARTQTLGENILNAGRIKNRPDHPSGNYPRSGRGGFQEHPARA